MMAKNTPCKHILLTGLPGVGKTTLVNKVAKKIFESSSISPNGFYTEELREERLRKGFDVVSIDRSRRAPLARKSEFLPAGNSRHMPMVGQYCVDVKSFEEIALPTLELHGEPQIFVVDEIGKMELFSKTFVSSVKRLFDSKSAIILATVPVSKGKLIPIVEDLKKRPDCQLITVTKSNREVLVKEVSDLLMNSYQNNLE